MPPSDPPATAASRSIPSSSSSARSARTMSATVMTGKSEPYGRPVAGFVRRRSGRPAAAAEQVGADDEKAMGVEGLAGTDHAVPPAEAAAAAGIALVGTETVPGARRHRSRRVTGGVRVAAERVADQNDVVACRRQRPVGLVGDADRVKLTPAVERQRRAEGRGTASRPCRPSPRRPWTLAWSCGRSYPRPAVAADGAPDARCARNYQS